MCKTNILLSHDNIYNSCNFVCLSLTRWIYGFLLIVIGGGDEGGGSEDPQETIMGGELDGRVSRKSPQTQTKEKTETK